MTDVFIRRKFFYSVAIQTMTEATSSKVMTLKGFYSWLDRKQEMLRKTKLTGYPRAYKTSSTSINRQRRQMPTCTATFTGILLPHPTLTERRMQLVLSGFVNDFNFPLVCFKKFERNTELTGLTS